MPTAAEAVASYNELKQTMEGALLAQGQQHDAALAALRDELSAQGQQHDAKLAELREELAAQGKQQQESLAQILHALAAPNQKTSEQSRTTESPFLTQPTSNTETSLPAILPTPSVTSHQPSHPPQNQFQTVSSHGFTTNQTQPFSTPYNQYFSTPYNQCHPQHNHSDKPYSPPKHLPKVTLPYFTGADVEGWLFQVERYFELYRTPEAQKKITASLYMSGEALDWYRFAHITQQIQPWHEFAEHLRQRFGPSEYWNVEVALSQLRHTTTLSAYIAEFEALSTRTPGLTADNLLHKFTAGLKDEIRRGIVLHRPTTLQQAMSIARIVEDQSIATVHHLDYQSTISTISPQPTTPPWAYSQQTLPTSQASSTTPSHTPFKRINVNEMLARKAKGLCYNCDEQYTPAHNCKARFHCLVMNDGEEPLDPGGKKL